MYLVLNQALYRSTLKNVFTLGLTSSRRLPGLSTNRSFSYTSLLQFASSYSHLGEHDNHNTFQCLGNLKEIRERANNTRNHHVSGLAHSNLR